MLALDDNMRDRMLGFVGLILLALAAIALYFGVMALYDKADSSGWISHEEDSVITAQTNWFVGESKNCTSYPLSPEAARAMGKNAGDAVQRVDCDNGPEHHFKIKFYGRVEQPEYVAVQWSCTRTAGGFTCSELSGVAPPPPPP